MLSHSTNIKGTVLMLGEPKAKSKYMLECSWPNLGIDIVFGGMGYSNPDAKMDYLIIYPR